MDNNPVTQQQIEQFVQSWISQKSVSKGNAYIILYELLLWCENINGVLVPHIVEVNNLRKRAWFNRALQARNYLAQQFNVNPNQLCRVVDNLMRGLGITTQRHNYLGRGLLATLKILITQLSRIPAEKEVRYASIPGLQGVGRERSDVVVPPPPDTKVIISAKWSLRHDRIKDIFDEAANCKRLRPDVKFFVVTNEFQRGRLAKALSSRYVDAVYHVHRPLLQAVGCNVAGLKDLSDLFDDVRDL